MYSTTCDEDDFVVGLRDKMIFTSSSPMTFTMNF